MPKLFIGTSGWNYPHWRSIFYPQDLSQGKWLEYYAKFFNCVELNVTFYRLLQKKTFQNWYRRTPKDFYFVTKGSRFITHMKKLQEIREPLNLFMENIQQLKQKLAAVLWQFPPSFQKDLLRLRAFLKLLRKTDIRQAFEFRNASWFDQGTFALLREYNVCLCIAHSAHFPYIKEVTSDFLYLRFHGGESLYSSNYSDKELKDWVKFTRPYKKNKDIFAFFNNDAYGYAVNNTKRFRELLKK
jgi:uncharacterized protein YecE (DUF72 family)